jgi:hypothetical protein
MIPTGKPVTPTRSGTVAQSTAASTQAHNSAAYRELDDCHAGTVLPLNTH